MESTSVPWRRLLYAILLVAVSGALNALAQTTPAPALTLTTVDGQTIRLKDLRGKIVLVNFWATTCAICLAERSELVQTYLQQRSKGFEVIAVAMPYDSTELIKRHMAKHPMPFSVVWDKDGEIGRQFGDVPGTPTTFIVDRNGRMVSKTVGPIDFDKLRRFLERPLN